MAYQAALGKLFDETLLKEVGKQQDFIVWFDAWWAEQCDEAARQHRTHIVLKQPLQTLLLPFLKQRIDPIFVFVTRPLKDIERTRRRRNWPAVYGAAGADALYKAAFNFLVANGCPYLSIPYDVFRSDPELRRKLIDFVELEPTDEMLSLAEDFLRPAG
ncbi:hypothetical protein [Yoonia sp.]|uniref:hypothetical protein n=1 Tax=Yoonia sp. TaxID=2212373 RepID=UPI0035C8632A